MKYMIIIIAALMSLNCYADNNCSMLTKGITLHFYLEGSNSEPNNFDPNNFTIIDTYHTDVEVSFKSSGWDPHLSYDSPGSGQEGQRVELEDGLLYGNSNTYYNSIPGGFEFTGVGAGGELWILPQNANNGELPLGFAAHDSDTYNLCDWNPNDPDKNADTGDQWFRVTLKDVRGPEGGQFSVWQTGPTTVFMSSYSDGITSDDTYYISAGGHRHLNWGFSKPGYYEIDFEIATVYNCQETLFADIWPINNEPFSGDCKVDLFDLALLAEYWLESNCVSESECGIADIYQDDKNTIDINELQITAGEWLLCGYPGCE